MPKVPYPYEVNGKLVTGNGSLIPICSLSNRSLLPSLNVHLSFMSSFSRFFTWKTCKEVHLENQYKSPNDMTTVSLLQCNWPDAYLSQKLVKWISLKRNLIVAIKRLEHLHSFPCKIVHVQHHNFEKQRDFKSLVHHTFNQKSNRAMEIPTLC